MDRRVYCPSAGASHICGCCVHNGPHEKQMNCTNCGSQYCRIAGPQGDGCIRVEFAYEI